MSSTSPTTAVPTTSAQPSLAPRELVDLAGSTWVITEVDGQPRPFVAYFEMSSGRITGHDGCNRYDAAAQVTAIVDGETSIELGERTSTAVQCLAFGENEEWWSAPDGWYRVDDDTLTITGTDGRIYEAVALETLEMVNSPEQVVGVWTAPGGASIEFAADGTIHLRCAAIGTWTFDTGLRTEIDETADTTGCGDFGPTSVGPTYEALVSTSPVIRILPDGSLLVGSSTFDRLAPSSSADVATIDSELGRVSYVLPSGSWPDPQDVGQLDDVTVGHAWWIVPDCCYLKLTLQDFAPPRPTVEHVGQFESNGLAWDMYDIGPRDHSTLVATATVDGLTISVGAQGRSGVSTDPSPSQIAESVARSVLVD